MTIADYYKFKYVRTNVLVKCHFSSNIFFYCFVAKFINLTTPNPSTPYTKHLA